MILINCINKLFENRIIDSITDCWNWNKCCNKKGYGIICVDQEIYLAHRLSAQIWLNFDPSSRLHVCHKCDNPKCFNPYHLFIGTNKDNMKDRDIKGRQPRGEKNGMALLNKEQILEIREKRSLGISYKTLMEEYKVSRTCLYRIVYHKRWKHINSIVETLP